MADKLMDLLHTLYGASFHEVSPLPYFNYVLLQVLNLTSHTKIMSTVLEYYIL